MKKYVVVIRNLTDKYECILEMERLYFSRKDYKSVIDEMSFMAWEGRKHTHWIESTIYYGTIDDYVAGNAKRIFKIYGFVHQRGKKMRLYIDGKLIRIMRMS